MVIDLQPNWEPSCSSFFLKCLSWIACTSIRLPPIFKFSTCRWGRACRIPSYPNDWRISWRLCSWMSITTRVQVCAWGWGDGYCRLVIVGWSGLGRRAASVSGPSMTCGWIFETLLETFLIWPNFSRAEDIRTFRSLDRDWMTWSILRFLKQWKDKWTLWSLDHCWMAWKTVRFGKQWKDNLTFWSLDHDRMKWRTARFSKQWKDNGTFWSLDQDWMRWRTVRFSKQWRQWNMEYCNHQIMTKWGGEQWDFRNNIHIVWYRLYGTVS